MHEYTLMEEHAGPLTVLISNVNDTGEDAEFSIVVVPEFPTAMTVMIMAAVSALGVRLIA
ncbi:MAG: hypothetical protein RMJ59_07155 [Candidatus Nitrosocaldus sp.]|nr:hypothetical protein [Candidatus Nitrosocaldus sp.]MDW8276136.1 hypothetical protein [Candidatus Nitrosocaldus sp.]